MQHELFAPYAIAAFSLAFFATLVVLQVVVATAAAQKAGHTPGVAIPDGPESFAFRAQRAHQNSLENAVPFLLALASSVALGVSPTIVNAAVAAFVATRVAHAFAYYAGARPPRTAAFVAGLAVILTMSAASLASAGVSPASTSIAACVR